MRIAPFTIGQLRFVHTGEWDQGLHNRTRRFLRHTNDLASTELYGKPVEWCDVPDPSFMQIFFAVFGADREFYGSWGLLDAEYADREQTQIRAIPSPAIPEMIDPEESKRGWTTFRGIHDWFLENPMPLVGGGTLELVEAKSPSGKLEKYAARLDVQMPRKSR